MNFHVLTLFPEMVSEAMNTSIIGRAIQNGLISIETVNIRDYTASKHKKVDDYPYGGGAGMLMQAQPIYDAYLAVRERVADNVRVIYLTPQGRLFNQDLARELAREADLLLLCGHYEGVDERVLEEVVTDHISIGDYVLSGGELAAMVVIDAVARLVPGVLTNAESGANESLADCLLEYPQYSRPEVWRERRVPEVLLSGDHARVEAWRREQMVERTKERRPDLYEKWRERQ
ncbi:MAG: tRNA (guanosine(37)-N1)-methyltransferase TrmD [Lachnospiraceae bacterium]|jgi:tRNA (guanine37-N1)-methyltransferase|nr:tRNA (guanosine(37)-N1)-methyltransferase TrmD [Lachnospiraceae bacterium]